MSGQDQVGGKGEREVTEVVLNPTDTEVLARIRDGGGLAHAAVFELPGGGTFSHPGMTMRQAYKLAALSGMQIPNSGSEYVGWQKAIAWSAASIADALVAEDAAHASKQDGPQ